MQNPEENTTGITQVGGILPGINDQPPPRPGGKVVQFMVVRDIIDRSEVGIERYGTLLMTDNGRDALTDGYQEVLDLAQYLRQEIEERRNRPPLTPDEATEILAIVGWLAARGGYQPFDASMGDAPSPERISRLITRLSQIAHGVG